MFQTHVSSVSSTFRRMLRIFYLVVSKGRSSVFAGDPPSLVYVREVEGAVSSLVRRRG